MLNKRRANHAVRPWSVNGMLAGYSERDELELHEQNQAVDIGITDHGHGHGFVFAPRQLKIIDDGAARARVADFVEIHDVVDMPTLV